jgi:hypothetical protein
MHSQTFLIDLGRCIDPLTNATKSAKIFSTPVRIHQARGSGPGLLSIP